MVHPIAISCIIHCLLFGERIPTIVQHDVVRSSLFVQTKKIAFPPTSQDINNSSSPLPTTSPIISLQCVSSLTDAFNAPNAQRLAGSSSPTTLSRVLSTTSLLQPTHHVPNFTQPRSSNQNRKARYARNAQPSQRRRKPQQDGLTS